MTLVSRKCSVFFSQSIVKRAINKNIVHLNVVNFRDFAENKHNQVDDIPYGGGAGMVIKPEPLFRAVRERKKMAESCRVVLLTPQGRLIAQEVIRDLTKFSEDLILIAGHYEGVDEELGSPWLTMSYQLGIMS